VQSRTHKGSYATELFPIFDVYFNLVIVMHIAIFVPEQAVMEAISPPYRLFTSANDFLKSQGKQAKFEVEFVGLSRSVKAQNGEYQINTHKTTDEVKSTQLIIVPALYGAWIQVINATAFKRREANFLALWPKS
jgi:hypothetical protein